MIFKTEKRPLVSLLTWLFWLTAGAAVGNAGEGFGFPKQVVELGRVQPPEISLPGKRIQVKATGQGKGGETEERLLAMLENRILANSPTLQLDTVNPQSLVEAALLQKEHVDTWENRQKTVVVANGKDAKGRTQYQTGQIEVKFRIVKMVLGISFRVVDGRSRKVLLADQISRAHDEAYENGVGAPEPDWLENQLITEVAAAVAARITPTIEKVGVLVPKGSLKDYVNFATAGLWDKYLEAVERMPARPAPKDESYRLYALGLAHEALAYGTDDCEVALRYLEQASVHYNAALAANPKEEYFVNSFQSSTFLKDLGARLLQPLGAPRVQFEAKQAMAPVERVRSALTQYQQWSEMQVAASAKDLAVDGGAADGSAVFDNYAVIEMVRARLPEEIVLKAIEDAPQPSFDVTPQGLIQLSQASVSQNIILRLQEIARKATKGEGR